MTSERLEENIKALMANGYVVVNTQAEADMVFREATKRYEETFHAYYSPTLVGWAVTLLMSRAK